MKTLDRNEDSTVPEVYHTDLVEDTRKPLTVIQEFYKGNGRIYNQIADEHFHVVIARNDGSQMLVIPKNASLGILSAYDYNGCYALATEDHYLAAIQLELTESQETKLANGITVYSDKEQVA
ncbi:hypothetical protein EG328_009596 [Venturia inaequalis]|uniref:Uncharacterized protein n=1 Tax=Venturia inaequalis TaxID=5025 RepID=A0A8H3U8W3_VENIN|nr:hypothetical protein EG328_009596 [Venturia inaequalis]